LPGHGFARARNLLFTKRKRTVLSVLFFYNVYFGNLKSHFKSATATAFVFIFVVIGLTIIVVP
jgi:uncharacterized membrane protein